MKDTKVLSLTGGIIRNGTLDK